MIAGNLDDKIVIQQLTADNTNEYAANSQTWTDYMTLRANVTDKSGKVTDANFESFMNHNITFITHYRKAIRRSNNMVQFRVVYDGEYYDIVSVLHDRSQMMTTINCTLINE